MTSSLIETKPRKGEGARRNFPSRHVSNPLLESAPDAGVAKLVDAPDLGSGAARRGGSSPSTRTKGISRGSAEISPTDQAAVVSQEMM